MAHDEPIGVDDVERGQPGADLVVEGGEVAALAVERVGVAGGSVGQQMLHQPGVAAQASVVPASRSCR